MTRRPVLQSRTFHTTLTATIRQNATRTPGDSARFTSVELSEKATTRPTTASTPSVFALGFRAGEGTERANQAAVLRAIPVFGVAIRAVAKRRWAWSRYQAKARPAGALAAHDGQERRQQPRRQRRDEPLEPERDRERAGVGGGEAP